NRRDENASRKHRRKPPAAKPCGLCAFHSSLEPSVPAIARREVAKGCKIVVAAELRPAFGRDVKFGVADLPEEKVAQPHFSRRANDEIGVRHAGGVETIGDQGFVDLVWLEPPGGDLF